MSREASPPARALPARTMSPIPHPSTEEHYDNIPRPGGATPPKGPDIGPNSYAHDGKAPPRPNNEGAKHK